MIDYLPSVLAISAAVATACTRQIAVSVGAFFTVFASVFWTTLFGSPGSPPDVESLAACLATLAMSSVIPIPAGRFWIGVALAGLLWPTEGVGSSIGLTLIAIGLVAGLLCRCDADGRVAVLRVGVVVAIWMTAITMINLVQPETVRGGPVDDLAISRARVPLAAALLCGLGCWPISTLLIDAVKRASSVASLVLPLLGLATLERLNVTPLLRGAFVGELETLFMPLGLFSLCVGAMIALAQADLRVRLVAAQLGLGGWTVALWFEDVSAARVLWATVAVASTVCGAVLGRLEHRYKSRERTAFSGLALRHPTTAVTLGFSSIVVARAAVGPVAMTRGLPVEGQLDPLAVVVILIAGLFYAAAFADVLRDMLFGVPRLPEYEGVQSQRARKAVSRRSPLVGPTTLFAWGIPLLFVIVLGVAPYNVLMALDRPATPAAPGQLNVPEPPSNDPEPQPPAKENPPAPTETTS